MFRRISYISMIFSVLLSWGILLNVAIATDRANETENQNAKAYLAKLNPATKASAAGDYEKLQLKKPLNIDLQTPSRVKMRK